MSTTWRTHYKSWTCSDLLVSNLLRPDPLPYDVLTQYAAHSIPTLRTGLNLLKRQGRVSRQGELILAHPQNQRMTTGVPFAPLPDPGSPPLTPSFVEGRVTAAEHAEEVFSQPEVPGLTKPRAAAILERWITEGSAGKDTPRFIDAWVDLVGSGHGAGPPPPSTLSDYTDWLFILLSAAPEPACRAAISRWEDSLARQPDEPCEAVSGGLHLGLGDSALGTGSEDPPGPEPASLGAGLPLENPLC